jgi:hypothetical protein
LPKKFKQTIFLRVLKKDKKFLIDTVEYKNEIKQIFQEVIKCGYESFYKTNK